MSMPVVAVVVSVGAVPPDHFTLVKAGPVSSTKIELNIGYRWVLSPAEQSLPCSKSVALLQRGLLPLPLKKLLT